MNLLRHIGTNCACTHAYILPVSTMLQDNVMQLSEFLLADYQFSSVRILIENVVVLRGVQLAVL